MLASAYPQFLPLLRDIRSTQSSMLLGTLNARIEQAAWMRLMQAGVILTSWTAFTGEIQHSYSQPPGAKLLQLIGTALQTQNGLFP